MLDYLSQLLQSKNPSHHLSAAELPCLQLELKLPLDEKEIQILLPHFTSKSKLLRHKLLSLYSLDPHFYKDKKELDPKHLLLTFFKEGDIKSGLCLLPSIVPMDLIEVVQTLSQVSTLKHDTLVCVCGYTLPLPSVLVDWVIQTCNEAPMKIPMSLPNFYSHFLMYTPDQRQALIDLLHRYAAQFSFPWEAQILLRAIDEAKLQSELRSVLVELSNFQDELIQDYASHLLHSPLGSPSLLSAEPGSPTLEPVHPELDLEIDALLNVLDYFMTRFANGHMAEHSDGEDIDSVLSPTDNELDCYI
ncbi:hypothetical protein HMI56_004086 [Coelomomyces lativittatus]|nr:hypothetical protein HMI56_004086 [Coelomomyces lativittatus]